MNTTVAARTVSVAVDSASPLAMVGSAALAQTSVGSFLIAHTSQDAFTVLTATCTHEGCTVTGFDNPQFVCPCHGSRYTTSGSVANGPASQPLRQFASQVVGGVLSFTA